MIYLYDKNVPTGSFQVKISESGTYKVIVTGEKAKGSVSFLLNFITSIHTFTTLEGESKINFIISKIFFHSH